MTRADVADLLHRREALAQALLEASTQFTFPLNVHQFLRLGDQWMDMGFKQMLGKRATKLYRKMFGEGPPKGRARGCGRNLIAVYPRGILEQAWTEIVTELGENIEQYRIEQYRKVPPSPELIEKRRNADYWRTHRRTGITTNLRMTETMEQVGTPASEAEITRWVKE
jgi:hypothetical protein